MKNLKNFEAFNLTAFLDGKELTVTGCRPWQDFDSKAVLGTRVEVVITKDATPYLPGKDGAILTNLYEKLVVKVPKEISVPAGAIITIVGGTASVYGDFRNQLSVKAEDVQVVAPPAKGGGRHD